MKSFEVQCSNVSIRHVVICCLQELLLLLAAPHPLRRCLMPRSASAPGATARCSTLKDAHAVSHSIKLQLYV
jgi:hypothetical protein